MISKYNNCYYYSNNNCFVNSFNLVDYIIINYPASLHLSQLLSLLFFYQIGANIFNKAIPFEDEILIQDDFLFIDDINKKYRRYKHKDLRKITIQKLPISFKEGKREEFLINLINYCSAIKEKNIIKIVLESNLFKLASLKTKKIIDFNPPSQKHTIVKKFKKESACLPLFL